jgi:hypothetical protein
MGSIAHEARSDTIHARMFFLKGLTQPVKVDFRLIEPETLADFCTSNELG